MIPALMIEMSQGSCGVTRSLPARATSTVPRTSPANSRGMRAIPSRSLRLTRAFTVTVAPPPVSVTSSPVLTPRCFASASESSTSACGRWNCSSDTRSTAGPEKSGL